MHQRQAERIGTDARHTDVKVLRCWCWGHSLLYALNYDDSLDRFEQASGEEAIALLAGLLPTFDMEPAFSCL